MGEFVPFDIWIWEADARIYGTDGKYIGRGKYVKNEVVGETSRSYVLKYGKKVPKKYVGENVAFCEEDVRQKTWVRGNRYLIAESVRNVYNYDKLKAIAEISGYKEQPK